MPETCRRISRNVPGPLQDTEGRYCCLFGTKDCLMPNVLYLLRCIVVLILANVPAYLSGTGMPSSRFAPVSGSCPHSRSPVLYCPSITRNPTFGYAALRIGHRAEPGFTSIFADNRRTFTTLLPCSKTHGLE